MIRTAHRPAVRTAAAAMLPLLIFCLLAAHAADTAAVTADRMRLCLETLIPSLFGCMAAANLLTGTGAAAWLGMACAAAASAAGAADGVPCQSDRRLSGRDDAAPADGSGRASG